MTEPPEDRRPPRDDLRGPRLVQLSGAGRGTSRPLREDELEVGIAPEADIHFPAPREPAVAFRHARLRRQGGTYRVEAEPGRLIKVNGRPVERHLLLAGDVLELGEGGPQLRYEVGRPTAPGARRAFRNALDRARAQGTALPARAVRFARALPVELHRALSPTTKAAVALLVAGLLTFLAVQNWMLGQRLEEESMRIRGIGELLERSEDRLLSEPELTRLRAELEAQLSERIGVLEARGRAFQVVISEASPSVVFLQGAYGFLEPESRQPIRLVTDDRGRTVRDDSGNPRVTTGDEGPIFERLYTGTGFVVSEDGLLLTNRHVALPWESDEPAKGIADRGFIPVLTRMVGYVPGREEPFDVQLVVASGTADLAVMRAPSIAREVEPLPLAERAPRPGAEIVVMGYPTGIRAVLARSDPAFVNEVTGGQRLDVWTLARRLSEAGQIAPLSTRGIVGQVTMSRVVYDAETTRGGSGGPVLGLDGEVVAINMAILPEFGGSNLGVPVEEAWRLLDLVAEDEADMGEDEAVEGQDVPEIPAPDVRDGGSEEEQGPAGG